MRIFRPAATDATALSFVFAAGCLFWIGTSCRSSSCLVISCQSLPSAGLLLHHGLEGSRYDQRIGAYKNLLC